MPHITTLYVYYDPLSETAVVVPDGRINKKREPSKKPTLYPTKKHVPSVVPTHYPSRMPKPTQAPVLPPTKKAPPTPPVSTGHPTKLPNAVLTPVPNAEVTFVPNAEVAPVPPVEVPAEPTQQPTDAATLEPSSEPTAEPTTEPTAEPTAEPSTEPSAEPDTDLSAAPTNGAEPEPQVPTPTAVNEPSDPYNFDPIVPIIGRARRTESEESIFGEAEIHVESAGAKYNLVHNPYSWSESAHMIFLEQPIR